MAFAGITAYEKQFAREQMERFGLQEKKELTAKGRELDKAKQWVDIHYGTIGLWYAPSPNEMEKLFREYLAGQQKRTAQQPPHCPDR